MANPEPPRPAASQTGSFVRARLSSACTVLGVAILTLGLLSAYASRVIFNSEAFADRLAASLPDPGVSAFIAERVTQGLIAKQRDLTAFEPLISATMRTLIASVPFRGIVRRAARVSHEAIMSGRARKVALNLADLGVILRSAIATNPVRDGIRALLIDVHYGMPAGDRVKTLLDDEIEARRKYEAVLGKEGIDAAMRIRDRLVGSSEGKRGVYLCHGFCELGSSPLIPMLQQIREFLVMNPGEVLMIILQDEGVTPKDIETCFQESGLIDFVYRRPLGESWPTLREMVAEDQRVLVFAENTSAGVSWYHQAYQHMQETAFRFHKPEDFSCQPNRGGNSGSLFLLNHWIETAPAPLPGNAEKVNAYDFLLQRARQCQEERRHLPNLIAVDFYRTGDVVAVARTLNRIEAPYAAAGTTTAGTGSASEVRR